MVARGWVGLVSFASLPWVAACGTAATARNPATSDPSGDQATAAVDARASTGSSDAGNSPHREAESDPCTARVPHESPIEFLPGTVLPDPWSTPQRDEVRAAFEGARLDVWRCLEPDANWESRRSLSVEASIGGAGGDVERISVSGELSPGESECIREAASRIHVRPFGQPNLTIRYSYAFSAPCTSRTPDPGDVEGLLHRVCVAARSCAPGGAAGSVRLQLTVQGLTGRVTFVNVTGDLSGPSATCIANMVRVVDFPVFCASSITVNFTCEISPPPAPDAIEQPLPRPDPG